MYRTTTLGVALRNTLDELVEVTNFRFFLFYFKIRDSKRKFAWIFFTFFFKQRTNNPSPSIENKRNLTYFRTCCHPSISIVSFEYFEALCMEDLNHLHISYKFHIMAFRLTKTVTILRKKKEES